MFERENLLGKISYKYIFTQSFDKNEMKAISIDNNRMLYNVICKHIIHIYSRHLQSNQQKMDDFL